MVNMPMAQSAGPARPGIIVRSGRALATFAGHLLLAAMVLIGVWIVWRLGYPLWSDEENPVLFDRFPPNYLFNTMDAFVIMAFFGYGLIDAVRTFRR